MGERRHLAHLRRAAAAAREDDVIVVRPVLFVVQADGHAILRPFGQHLHRRAVGGVAVLILGRADRFGVAGVGLEVRVAVVGGGIGGAAASDEGGEGGGGEGEEQYGQTHGHVCVAPIYPHSTTMCGIVSSAAVRPNPPVLSRRYRAPRRGDPPSPATS